MGHHFTREEKGYKILTIVDTGFTISVLCPARGPLSEEDLGTLMGLLDQQDISIQASLCKDALNSGSFHAYDGGVVEKESALLSPVHARGIKGPVEILPRYQNGIDRVKEAIATYGKDSIRQISVMTDFEIYLIYSDPKITQLLGAVRIPTLKLRDLANESRERQRIQYFVN